MRGSRAVGVFDDRNDHDDPFDVGDSGFYGVGCRERENGYVNRYAVDYSSSGSAAAVATDS